MSMTQGIVDELRELAKLIDREGNQAARPGQMTRLHRYAATLRELAEELGDD